MAVVEGGGVLGEEVIGASVAGTRGAIDGTVGNDIEAKKYISSVE